MDENDDFDWRDWITSDPDVMVGKPVVKGTRLTVEFLLRLLADGWNEAQIRDNYPHLPPEALRAVFAFARDSMEEMRFLVAAPAGRPRP